MISLMEALTEADIPEIFSALFPYASITGASKCKTMEIIQKLESESKGLYTGTIGYMGPSRKAQFNVAIRAAVIHNRTGEAQYSTGGGITWESETAEEYNETHAKTRVLTEKIPPFSLLKTLLWEEGKGYSLLDQHIERMKASAEYFISLSRKNGSGICWLERSPCFPVIPGESSLFWKDQDISLLRIHKLRK